MKKTKVNFIDPIIEKYCIDHSSKEEPLLEKLNRETHHKNFNATYDFRALSGFIFKNA